MSDWIDDEIENQIKADSPPAVFREVFYKSITDSVDRMRIQGYKDQEILYLFSGVMTGNTAWPLVHFWLTTEILKIGG